MHGSSFKVFAMVLMRNIVVGLVVLCLSGLAGFSSYAMQAAQIDTVYGNRAPAVGELVDYRIRLRQGVSQPVAYAWDFSDGARTVGITASRRFAKAGQIRIIVEARNRYGRDFDTLHVAVRPPAAPQPTADELNRASSTATFPAARKPARPGSSPAPGIPSSSAETGYIWVVASFLHQEAAEAAMGRYRKAGRQISLMIDRSGTGSPAYRLIMGPYPNVEAALRARESLPAERPGPALLLSLSEMRRGTSGLEPPRRR